MNVPLNLTKRSVAPGTRRSDIVLIIEPLASWLAAFLFYEGLRIFGKVQTQAAGSLRIHMLRLQVTGGFVLWQTES